MGRRRAAIEGGPSGNRRRLLAGTAVILLLGAGAFFILTAGAGKEAGAPDTSETADMQDREALDGDRHPHAADGATRKRRRLSSSR